MIFCFLLPIHIVPLLQRLDVKKSEYKEAYDLFKTTWVKGAVPEPEAIYAITNCKLSSSFQTFTKQLREEEADASTSRVFHGTSLLCDMLNNAQVCHNSECGVCGITQMGFDPSRIGTNIPRFMRYGRGFYFAPNSSKCHDYTQGAEEYGVRAQLLCLVASGTRFETTSDHTSLTQPPQQYDSVYGRAGGTLNYPEVVVYQREAILPQFVIVYRHNGVHKIAK